MEGQVFLCSPRAVIHPVSTELYNDFSITMNLQIFFWKTPFDRGKNDFSISIKNRKLTFSALGPFSRGRSHMENIHKETNLLCMNFTEVEHVFVGSTWKRYKNFPIDGANASGVKKWPLPSGYLKYFNISLKRGKKIPFLGYTRRIQDLSIIAVGIINNSRIWENNCVDLH